MEPFRPIVDRTVFELIQSTGVDAPLDQQTRATLIRALLSRVVVQDQFSIVIDALSVTAASLAQVIVGDATDLTLPQEFAHAAA